MLNKPGIVSLVALATLALGCGHAPARIGSVDVGAWANAQPPPGPSRLPAESYDVIRPRVTTIAKQQNVNLVLDRSQLFYAAGDMDFTATLLGGAMQPIRIGQRIAVVNLQRALERTRDARRARALLKAEFDRKQAELDQRQEALKQQYREGRDAESAQGLVQLKDLFRKLQAELQKHENEATHALLERMQLEVAELAQQHGFDVVIEVSNQGNEVVYNDGVAYPPRGPDVTDELIGLHDQRFPAP
jgi:Skp family chaperone for outer membrane proteins